MRTIWQFLVAIVLSCTALGAAHADADRPAVVFPQLGHGYPIMAIAYSPDGALLATGSADKTIRLWDRASGREMRTLTGHTAGVLAVAFSPSGKSLASSSADGTIKVWDIASGRELFSLTGHTDVVNSIAFSPDGAKLASGSADGSVKFWDLIHRKLLVSLDGSGPVAFSPDGKRVAFRKGENNVALIDAADPDTVRVLGGHTGAVTSIAFTQGGKVLAAGSQDKTVLVWDLASSQVLRTFTGHAGAISSIAMPVDGHMLASAGANGSIELWDTTTGQLLRTAREETGAAMAIAFSPNGSELAAATWGHTVDLWNVSDGTLTKSLKGRAGAVEAVAVSADSKLMASASWDHVITLWDLTSGKPLRALTGHSAGVMSVAFAPDGTTIASAGADKTVKLWDVASGREIRSLTGHSDTINSVAFSPDGRMVASGGDDHRIVLWEVRSGALLHDLHGHADAVESVAFSRDGLTLASASDDHTIKLWRVADGAERRTLTGHTDWVNSVAFSPLGNVLASGGFDNTIRFWDAASGRELHVVPAESVAVNAVAFSPDGMLLATAGADKTVKVWKVDSGEQIHTLSGNGNSVNGVAFVPDGKTLLSAGIDGTSRLWNIATGTERLALIAFADASSIAVTPEGFFDSSSEQAEENLNVRINDRVFGIASFREYFYRPDLVKLALAGTSLAQFGNINAVKLPPVVELVGVPATTKAPSVKLTVRLTNGGGGIGLVRVFWRGTAIVQDGDTPVSSPVATRSYTVPLFDGANDLRVTASNSEGSAWGDARQSVNAALPLSADSSKRIGTLHVVAVGIQEFPKSPAHNLKYASSDAQLFLSTIQRYSAPLFAKLDVTFLATAAVTDKTHLTEALKAMQKSVGPNDQFIFYVASHGVVSAGEYYLITSNVGSAAPGSLQTDALSGRDLTDLLANIPVARKLVIIDTCDSAPLGTALQQALATRGMSASTEATILSRSIGLTILAATTTNQEAIEGYKDHGLFTFVVADGLAGRAADISDGVVDSSSLAAFVAKEVPSLAQIIYGRQQQPTASVSGQAFVVSKVK